MDKDIFIYLKGRRSNEDDRNKKIDEDNIDSILETLVIDTYTIDDLKKMESMCSILAASSKEEEDEVYYKTKEIEILEKETKLENNDDDFFRLAMAYEHIADLFRKGDKKRAEYYLEREVELIKNSLEISNNEKRMWLLKVNTKRAELISKNISSLEDKIEEIEEYMIIGGYRKREFLMKQKAEAYSNLINLCLEEGIKGLEKVFELEDKKVETLECLLDLTKNVKYGIDIIYTTKNTSKLAHDNGEIEREKHFLKKEYEISNKLKNFNPTMVQERRLEMGLFYIVGHLGNTYKLLNDVDKAIRYKREEIEIGIGIIENQSCHMSERNQYKIKKRLIHSSSFTAKILKDEIIRLTEEMEKAEDEVMMRDVEDKKNAYIEESIRLKEGENRLLKDDLVIEYMDKNKRNAHLIYNHSKLARLKIERGEDDIYNLQQALEYSKKIPGELLKEDVNLLRTLKYVTKHLNKKLPSETYSKMNEEYEIMMAMYFPGHELFYEQG